MSWHMSEKVMVSVISGLVLSVIGQIGSYVYLAKMLNTTPPLPERVLKLEIQVSEFGKTLDKINETMKQTGDIIREVSKEQSRRKPMVDYIEHKINRADK